MIIYIRHAKDRQHGGEKEFDTTLTTEGKKDSIQLGKLLENKYGCPDIIYCSPFIRTRQTARYLLKGIQKEDKPIIKIDPKLSRYGGMASDYSTKIRTDTKRYGYIGNESSNEFKNRVKIHTQKSLKKQKEYKLKSEYKKELIVWYITHAIFVKYVSRHFRINSPEVIGSRDWVNINTKESSWDSQEITTYNKKDDDDDDNNDSNFSNPRYQKKYNKTCNSFPVSNKQKKTYKKKNQKKKTYKNITYNSVK